MPDIESSYLGYYQNDNSYVYSYLYASDIEINRIPRLGSVIGYAQALIDMSEETNYQLVDYIESCQDDNNKLKVVVKSESQHVIPSSFFTVMTDAWVKMTQCDSDQVHFTFNAASTPE